MHHPIRLWFACLLCLAMPLMAWAADQSSGLDWPAWRGPRGGGVADGRKLPLEWSLTKNILWSVTLPGWGASSPVVQGERIYLTSEVEAEGKKSLLTLCYDRMTGREVWRHDFGFGVSQRVHAKSNLAANTPTVAHDALYVAFANADIARYTLNGELKWVTRYLSKFGDPKMSWGYNVSPLMLEDSVFFPFDHHTGPCFLIGLDKATGAVSWQKDRPIGTAHATPLLVKHHGQQDLLIPGKNRLTAIDAKTHKELWQYGEGSGPYNGEIISSPVCEGDIVYCQLWRQSPIHAIRLRGDGLPPEPLWINDAPGPVEPSLLAYRGLLYVLKDNGVMACLDGRTGAQLYKERLGEGGECNSSPIASDGKIYASNIRGLTFVLRAGRDFKLLSTNDLAERISASPAISGDSLIYRTDSHLFCIGSAK